MLRVYVVFSAVFSPFSGLLGPFCKTHIFPKIVNRQGYAVHIDVALSGPSRRQMSTQEITPKEPPRSMCMQKHVLRPSVIK